MLAFLFWGVGFKGFGFWGALGLGSRSSGLRFGLQSCCMHAQNALFASKNWFDAGEGGISRTRGLEPGSGLRGSGFGFRASGLNVWGLGFRV